MKEENNIDQLFREGSQKDYAYDENLWAQLQSELPSTDETNNTRSFWGNIYKLLFVLTLILFLETDSIVSHNQYTPRQNNAHTDISKTSASDGKLEVDQNIQNTTTSKASKSIEAPNEAKLTSRPIDETRVIDQTSTSPIQVKKQIIETAKQTTPTQIFHQTNSISSKDDNEIALVQAEVNDLDPTQNSKQSELAFNSNFEAKSTLPTIGEMSRLNSMGLQGFMDFNERVPLENETNKLNKLQQKFKKREYYVELEYARSLFMDKQISGLEAGQEEYRSQAENSRFQQSMGVNILTNVKRFTVGLGIHKSSFHERLSYTYNEEINRINVSYDTSYTIVNDNFNSNGTPVILIRENIHENRTKSTENVEKELIINNQFQRISLPLSLGYTQSFGRFNVGLRTALVLNYLYAFSGGYISSNRDSFYAFDEKQQLEEWMIGNRNQLRLGYSLNEFVLVGTSLNHEHDLTSFTQGYSSKFSSYGLGFWLVYRPR